LQEKLSGWMSRAQSDPQFVSIHDRFARAGVRNWLHEDEKLLLFSIGAYAPGQGVIVEIGSFQGASAIFLAAGIAGRGQGHLYSVDPHLAGPPWLGTAPSQITLEIFREKVKYCGVDAWVCSRVGDSAAVAAVWPAEPIDALFIDGDHSFRGALKDLESWLPKVRSGGYVLIDDADNKTLMELVEFFDLVKKLQSLKYLGTVEGIAVFERNPGSPWDALQEIRQACAQRGIHRPWDYSWLHQYVLPDNYRRSRSWPDDLGLDYAYQLCFLARCGPGSYGYSSRTRRTDREVLRSLSRDRNDGKVVRISKKGPANLRALLCTPEEAADLAPLLIPGGVLISREEAADSMTTRGLLIQAGLEGCGFGSGLQWGVWQASYLSSDAIMDYALRAYRE
jgi:predicted O-methyltransferase YrrM